MAFTPNNQNRMFFPKMSLYWHSNRQATLGQDAPPPPQLSPGGPHGTPQVVEAINGNALRLEAELAALRRRHGIDLEPVAVKLSAPVDYPVTQRPGQYYAHRP